jgi:L-ascorbate metabolism protein UlaG (beta-lactamase superfamily)
VQLTLIRNATVRVEVAGHTLLVDPQLDPAGARDAVPDTPNPRRSPLALRHDS